MEPKLIKCPNCGADFDVHLPKCPYCGFMNPEGAEEQYLNKLEETRQELDGVDELAAENVKAEVKENTELLKKKFVQIGIAVIILGCLGLLMTRYYACSNKSSELTAEEMQWQREAFSQLESLYEAGDYEVLIDRLNEYSTQDHRVWDWGHYNFAYWYQEYILIREALHELEQEGQCTEELGNILFRHMFEFYDLRTGSAVKLGVQTEKDAAVLDQCREEIVAAIHERLMFSDEDITGFYDRIHDSRGYLDYKECEKVVKEHYQQFR